MRSARSSRTFSPAALWTRFRYLYPDKTGAYSWWSYMYNARANNAGGASIISSSASAIKGCIEESCILPEVMGSDHCPVMLEMGMPEISE